MKSHLILCRLEAPVAPTAPAKLTIPMDDCPMNITLQITTRGTRGIISLFLLALAGSLAWDVCPLGAGPAMPRTEGKRPMGIRIHVNRAYPIERNGVVTNSNTAVLAKFPNVFHCPIRREG